MNQEDITDPYILGLVDEGGKLAYIALQKKINDVEAGKEGMQKGLHLLESSDMVQQFGKVRVNPDGIMGFRRGPGEGETDEIGARLNQFGHIIISERHAAGHKPDLGSLVPDEANDFNQPGVEKRLSPSFEDDGIDIPEVGKDFLEIFQSHILPRHAVVAFPAAHFATQGAAGGELDLPGGKGFPPSAAKKMIPETLLHNFDNKPSREAMGEGW
jgi:hypothetical protein